MGAIGYLYRRTTINRIKTAIKKPITYIYLLFVVVYLIAVPISFKTLLDDFEMASPSGMALGMTLFGFWMLPVNLITYAKRKGLIYRNCDVHFMFPSPIGPKQVLFYAHIRSLITGWIMNLIVAVLGALLFHVEIWHIVIYLLLSMVINNILEGSIMMVVYGSEKIQDYQRKWIVAFAYALTIAFFLIGIYFAATKGVSLETAIDFLHSDQIQLVPITGWYIGSIHLIFMGPTTVNIIGTVCFVLLTVVMLVLAVKMKCTGLFYEDAITFAEDYEVALRKSKEGRMAVIGKKQKFGKAKVEWKGKGAKALFYKQLLECKKSKFFVFDANSLISLLAGVGIVIFYYFMKGEISDESEREMIRQFLLPGIGAYLIFVFSSMVGDKWAKELKSPYTFLLPDSGFRKLLYATLMHNIQFLIGAILLMTPGAIVMKISPISYVLFVEFYVLLASNKLYALAVAEIVVGNILGTVGKQLLQMFVLGIVITVSALGAILGYYVGGVMVAYVLMNLFLFLFDAIFAVIASLNFEKMETV